MDLEFPPLDSSIQSNPDLHKTTMRVIKIGKILLHLCFFLWALLTLCFIMTHMMPGDPFLDEQAIPEEVMQALRHKWGTDQPLFTQYIHYINRIFHGDLGYSMRYPTESVVKIIVRGFPVSFFLGMQALFIAIPLGALLGGLSAYYANKPIDVISMLCATIGISVPSFVLAAVLQLVLASLLPIFPVARGENLFHTILPSLALAIGPTCSIMRLMRANTLDILSKEWVVTARMKGLSEKHVLLHHVAPNAILPVFHYIGPTIANLLVGSFVVERVFSLPGLGQWFVNGVITRDYTIISGLTLFYSLILFSVHSFINIVTVFLDPRMNHKNERA